jgi:hypothetical protein
MARRSSLELLSWLAWGLMAAGCAAPVSTSAGPAADATTADRPETGSADAHARPSSDAAVLDTSDGGALDASGQGAHDASDAGALDAAGGAPDASDPGASDASGGAPDASDPGALDASGGAPDASDAGQVLDGSPTDVGSASGDVYRDVFNSVDRANLERLLREMTGYDPIVINNQTVRISERYTPQSKANYRAYWQQYYRALGATVTELPYPTQNYVGETEGHNLEAVFQGQSADSIVAIVHYDSVGAPGHETENPAVDDDMTPMAIQMEAARILSQYQGRLNLTVRFVATDYEEITTLEGGRAYVAQLQQEASTQGFRIVAAIDGELSGWSCWDEGACGANPPPPNSTLTVASCTADGTYNFPTLGQQIADIAAAYSSMTVNLECDSETDGSELYNFWRIGVPAFYFEEFNQDANMHYDQFGDDTLAHINLDYYFQIGQIAAVFIAKLVGIAP